MIRTLQARLNSLSKFHIHNARVRSISLSHKVYGGHGRNSVLRYQHVGFAYNNQQSQNAYVIHTNNQKNKFRKLPHRSISLIAGILQGHKGLWSNKNCCNGIKSFCTAQDLSMKKCIPCSSKDLRSMTEDAAHQLIPQVPGWDLVNEGGTWKLHRSWKVKSFTKGMEFFQLIANVAEVEGHHPDLHLVGWNNVKIDIWTHAVGGLTENDFILAAKINGLDLHHLLSKKTAK